MGTDECRAGGGGSDSFVLHSFVIPVGHWPKLWPRDRLREKNRGLRERLRISVGRNQLIQSDRHAGTARPRLYRQVAVRW
jgi:hypothetical protein